MFSIKKCFQTVSVKRRHYCDFLPFAALVVEAKSSALKKILHFVSKKIFFGNHTIIFVVEKIHSKSGTTQDSRRYSQEEIMEVLTE